MVSYKGRQFVLMSFSGIYTRCDGVIEVIIRDESGKKIDRFICNISDKELYTRLKSIWEKKYGLKNLPTTEQDCF